MDGLITVIANSGNLAVIVLVIANGGLMYMLSKGFDAWRSELKELTQAIYDLRASLQKITTGH
mgnify:CR=1 FL=1